MRGLSLILLAALSACQTITPSSSETVPSDSGLVTPAPIVVSAPEPFSAVGYWYADFAQTEDREVTEILGAASA